MKSAIKTVARVLFFNPLFFFRTSFPVWYWILNHEPRKKFREMKLRQVAVTKRVLDDLLRDGIAVTSLEELFPGQAMLQKLVAYADHLMPQAKVRTGKPFLKALWEEDMTLELSNPFMRLALSDEVLSVINGYMGMLAKFFFSALDLTLTVPENAERLRSQNWHRDPDDKKMVKMFLYLSDVDEGSGPFTYIHGSHFGGKWERVFPQDPPKGSYPETEEVTRRIPQEDVFIATGKAGSVIFADTAGLHRGGYAHTRERLMFTAEYSSKATLRPIRYRLGARLTEELGDFSPAARYAVSKNFGWFAPLNALSFMAIKYGIYRNPTPHGERY